MPIAGVMHIEWGFYHHYLYSRSRKGVKPSLVTSCTRLLQDETLFKHFDSVLFANKKRQKHFQYNLQFSDDYFAPWSTRHLEIRRQKHERYPLVPTGTQGTDCWWFLLPAYLEKDEQERKQDRKKTLYHICLKCR